MPRKRSKTHSAAGQPRRTRRIHEEAPGRAPGKLPEIAGCPECGASYRNGRWTWKKPPVDAHPHVCPACARIAADDPAGVIHVEGDFSASQREELVALLQHLEERERGEHPLKRIMAIADEAGGFRVTVTDGKLAQSFGRALRKAHGGRLEHSPTTSDTGNLVRVRWVHG